MLCKIGRKLCHEEILNTKEDKNKLSLSFVAFNINFQSHFLDINSAAI